MDEVDADDGRWMTYAEIAEARRMSRASAERVVRRHRWRRQADNQGTVRALVPQTWSDPVPEKPADNRRDIRADTWPDITAVIAPLQAAIDALREQLARSETRANQAENRANRAEQALIGERDRVDELRERLDDLGSKLAAAQAELALCNQVEATAERRGGTPHPL